MNDFGLIDILSILSLFLGLLFTLFLFTAKAKNRLSNQIFGVFMFLSAIDNIFISRILHDDYFALANTIAMTVFLQLPIFYLYVKSVCYSDFRLKKIHLAHAIPFVIVLLIIHLSHYGRDTGTDIFPLSEMSDDFKNKLVHVMAHVQVFSYLTGAFLVVRRSKKLYLENYTNTAIPYYNWIVQLISVLFVLHVFAVLKNIYKFTEADEVYYWTRVVLLTTALLVFCWYVLKALNHPDLFKSVDSKLTLASDMSETVNPSKIDTAEEDIEVQKVKRYMAAEKPFLEPSLTIQQLAHQIQLPVKELSVLINHKMGQHFFDFVNEFRIAEAKTILIDPDKKQFTVLEILYEVGFNSKSSFNTAFKKYTGTTPTQYRKNPEKSLNRL